MNTDIIVVGAGVNGLVAAAALARAGRRVTVLERRATPGGVSAAGRIAGLDTPSLLHDTARLHPAVRAGLELDVPLADAPPVTLADGSALGSRPEIQAWRASIERWRPLTMGLITKPAPRTTSEASPWAAIQAAVAFRRLGQADLLELLRVGPQSADDWLSETLEDPVIRGAVATDGLIGTWMGPRSPGSAATLLLHALTSGDREVVGGAPALVTALVANLAARGVELRTDAAVARIRVVGGQVRGVTLEDGAEIEAGCVISAVDPRRTLLDLLPPDACPPHLEADAAAHRCRGTHAVVRVALAGRAPCRHLRLVRDIDQLERAFDAVKYGELADDVPMDARFTESTGSVLTFGCPYDLRAGWTDEARARVGDAVRARLGDAGVEVSDLHVLAPPDLEAELGCSGGHLLHGELALDQLWVGRPSLALSGHRTPVEGLWLGSMGTHPGGGILGGSGWSCARAVLEAR